MTIGTVRWFYVPKGYGFLKPDDGGVDVLVDVRAVERARMASLYQGQRLSFDVVYDKRIGKIVRREFLGGSGLQAGARIDVALPFDPRSIHRQSEYRRARAGAERLARLPIRRRSRNCR